MTTTTPRPKRTRAWLAAAGIATGLTLGTAGMAAAATNGSSSTSTPSSSTSSATAPAGSGSTNTAPAGKAADPAALAHGPGETLLTGTSTTKAKAAAEAAEPGATVIRAETDAQGAAYEVHMKKADGSNVTVKLDANFKVTAIQTGFGTGPSH